MKNTDNSVKNDTKKSKVKKTETKKESKQENKVDPLFSQQQRLQQNSSAEPDHTEVWKYMMAKGVDTAFNEAKVFVAYNAKRSWDCLPDWRSAADLWCARILEHEVKKGGA